MPIFEYSCNACGSVNEFLTGVSSDEPEIKCTTCGSEDLKKLMSAANFSVKGSSAKAAPERLPCGANPDQACAHCAHAE